jgi:acetate---CoA ligase (ADP-forming)
MKTPSSLARPRPSLAALLNPRSVAVIGASDDPLRIGGRPLAYMKSHGFQGRIYPVNPGRPLVQGLPAFPTISALPEAPELAIVAVAASLVPEVVAELAERGTQIAIIFSSGFAESGATGQALQSSVLAHASQHGMRVLGPNSLGLLNPRNGFYATFTSSLELGVPKVGGVAIVSQSGAYGGHLMVAATRAGIGLSACVFTGNEADLSLGEIIHLLVDDPATEVIALYSEGLKEGAKFVAALQSAAKARKPVVMIKVGRSEVGSLAAQSHTGSLAGNDRVIDAVLDELGVVRVNSTEQLLDVVRLATRGVYPPENALGVITVSGGAGVLISDAAAEVGLPMPAMPQAAQDRIRGLLAFAAPRNPVDVTAQFLNDLSLVGQFFEAMVAEGGYPSVLAFFTYTGGAASV